MADLPTLYNSLVDVLASIANATELKEEQVWRDITHSIRMNLPDKADDMSVDTTPQERVDETSAYALASRAMRTASEAWKEATAPELLPDEVGYGKATADYTTGNTVTLTPTLADGTAITPTPSNIAVWITFPTDNAQIGYDIKEDDVLAYFPIPSLGGKVGILFPVAQARPATGDYVWTSQDGVMSWVEMSTFVCP
jgi:hypothetical protein